LARTRSPFASFWSLDFGVGFGRGYYDLGGGPGLGGFTKR